MSQDQDALVSLNIEVWLSRCGKFLSYFCLMARNPRLLGRGGVVPVTSLTLQVLLQKAPWPPLVDLPSLSRFFYPLLFVGLYPERYVSSLWLFLFLRNGF